MSDKVTVDISPIANNITVAPITTSVEISQNTTTVELKSVTYENNITQNVTNVDITPTTTTVEATVNTTTVDISPNTTTVGVGDASIVASNLASATNTSHDSNSWITGGNVQASFDNLATTADSRYVNVTGDTMTAALDFPDQVQARFGDDGDLRIYHDSNASYIDDQGTGSLHIRANDLYLQKYTGANYFSAIDGGATTLFYNGNTTLATTNAGVNVTGEATATVQMEAPLFKGDLEGAVHFKASGSNLAKGDVVYITGYLGQRTTVDKADASDSAKMPAFGIVNAVDGGNVDVLTFGSMLHLSTTGIATGTELYVSATTPGGYETSAPTGEGSLVQKIAKVVRGDSNSGSIKIMGAGRTNATPNLNNGNIFIGNSSNIPTTASFDTTFGSSLATRSTSDLSEGTNLYYTTARFDTAFGGKSTSDLSEGTNLYYTDARADARISAASIGDLSDVDITTNTPTNDQVLVWNTNKFVPSDQSAAGVDLTAFSVGDNATANGSGGLAYNNTSGVFTYTPPNLSSYLTSETTTSLALESNILKYTDEQGTENEIDISLYLDDTNLARLTSGTLDSSTGTATFTRSDNTTFTVDFSSLINSAEVNDLTASVTWANVPNANITEGSVTQHQAALSITESQISDFGTYLTSETSHTDVLVDGDFTENGFMKRTGAGTYTVDTSTYLTEYTETDPVVGAIDGIVKADGDGTISAAVAGTDYSTLALGTDSTTALAGNSSIENLSNVSSNISPASNSVLAYNSTASEYQPYFLNDVAEIENQYIEVSTGAGVTANKPYYASSYDGANNRPIVALTDADNEQPCIGIATETVGSGSVTKLLTKGIIRNIDTTTTAYPGTGNLLYISSTQGQLTRTAPVSYQTNLQQVATVLSTNATTGAILVDITASQVGVANLAEGYVAYGGPNGEQTALYDDVSLPIRASAGPSGSREYWNVLRLTDANGNYTGDINHIQIGQAEADEDSQLVDKISLFPGANGVRIHNSEAIGTEGVSGQTLAFHTTDDGIHVGNDRRGTYTAGDLMINDDTDFGMLAGHDSSNVGSNNFGFGSDLTFETNTANNLCVGGLNTVNDTVSNSLVAGGSNTAGVADSTDAKEGIFVGGRVTEATNSYSFSWGKGNFDSFGSYPSENFALGGVLFGEQTKLHTDSAYSLVGGGLETQTNGYAKQQIDGAYSISWGRGINLASSSDYTAAFGRQHYCTAATYSFLAGEDHDAGYNNTHFGAVGKTHKIEGDYSFAAGLSNNPIGDGAVCLGASLKTPLFQPVVDVNGTLTEQGDFVWDNYSTVVGAFNDESHKYHTVYPTDGTVPTAWVEDHRFVVGTGTASNAKANGFIVALSDADFSGIIMPALAASTSHSSGSVAKAAGVPVGGLYHTNGVVKVVLSTD